MIKKSVSNISDLYLVEGDSMKFIAKASFETQVSYDEAKTALLDN